MLNRRWFYTCLTTRRWDTIKIFEDFEFPYSYKNLRYSYPTLIIEGGTKSSGSATPKNGFIYGLNIDRIILKSKEE